MFEIYNERTGDIVRRVRDVVTANKVCIDYTSAYAWINNDKFDYRTTNDHHNSLSYRAKRARELAQKGLGQTNR